MNEISYIAPQNEPRSNYDDQLVVVFNRQLFKKFFIILAWLGIIALIILVFPLLKSIITPMVISLLLSLLLTPLVDQMENSGINRGAAIGLLFIFFGSLIALCFKFLIPIISYEIETLSRALANKDAQTLINKLQITLTQRIPILKNPEIARQVSARLQVLFTSLLTKSLNLLFAILSSFTMIIVVPFMTFFFLKDGHRIKKFIIQSVPNRYFEMSLNLLYKINLQLGNYFRGQLLVSMIIGALSVVTLYSLNVPYFFIIGIIAGLANMIPYFGPVVGALPAILVAIVENGTLGPVLGIVIAFAMIQLLDNILISPLIVSKSIQIHPLLVILVILIGSNIGGIFGMLLAVPLFAVVQVIVKEIVWSVKHYRLSG